MSFGAPVTNAAKDGRKIKVMIIDDSAIIRGLVTRWIGTEPDLELVGVGVNGLDGVSRATKLSPDVIILDIEMPQMDGITALPLLLKAVPNVKVIMASTLTTGGAQITIKALSLGATDYIAKPDAGNITGAEEYKRDLFSKLRAFGLRKTPHSYSSTAASAQPRSAPDLPRQTGGPITLRPQNSRGRPDALFIGSSTGGPEALRVVVQGLAGKINVPIYMTQHMPVLFTKILAEHLTKQTGAKVIEATHNMTPTPGVFHLAPGGMHMVLSKSSAGAVRILLNEDPPENFCRPAVDPLFRSAAAVYGEKALAVVLTGMGHDGRDGAKILAEKNCTIIAQDEASSVVWGMPGAIASSGLATLIKPINEIAPAIINILRGVAA